MAAQANGQTGNGGKGNKTVVILLGVIIVLLIAVVGVFGAMLLKSNKANEELQQAATETQEKREVVVSQDNAEELAEEMIQQEYVEPGYYEVVMSTTWHFPTGDEESKDSYVENVPSNTNDVYFDLFLSDDEEHTIYESPIIPRGEKLENIKLNTKLEAGTYDCLMIYHLVDENQNSVSEVRVGLNVIVEK
ncbi:hypothetical protein [Butyrivibrio sp. AE3006]|uniref:hypothetical protein n=1 Tax=Butyrivibrio sp. AE3006 TaxID=1280673 RepID=UPI0004052A78|nr:hypothetical protein [Butyrivibrio sp. AE3006]